MSTEIPKNCLVVNPLALDLDKVLGQLDSETAALLERTVRDALALAERRSPAPAGDALGYPAGYFEATAGSFANEPVEAPQVPLRSRVSLPLVRCVPGMLVNPTAEELDDGLWD